VACELVPDQGVPAALAPAGMSVSCPKEDSTGTHLASTRRRRDDARDRGVVGLLTLTADIPVRPRRRWTRSQTERE
jgi:hypothetical protein